MERRRRIGDDPSFSAILRVSTVGSRRGSTRGIADDAAMDHHSDCSAATTGRNDAAISRRSARTRSPPPPPPPPPSSSSSSSVRRRRASRAAILSVVVASGATRSGVAVVDALSLSFGSSPYDCARLRPTTTRRRAPSSSWPASLDDRFDSKFPGGAGRRRRRASLLSRGGGLFSSDVDDGGDSNDDTTTEASMPEQKRRLTVEFLSIALPALIQLAAEPLAGLVDTAYLGRLGPDVLGGAGVAISAQYAVSKLYNDPLLRTSISLVASEDGRGRGKDKGSGKNNKGEDLSVAVSSALLLAFAVGTIQLVLYFAFAGSILRGMGVGPSSPMHHSAYSYLRVRALGTPAATLWLVTNGVFRGLGDTTTPLKYSLMFTALNAILDPFFIFTLKYGASGAAAGTAIAQYAALVPLLYSLHRKVGVDVLGQWRRMGGALKEYLRAGSYVFLRTVGKVLAYSVCARQAALLGSVAAAAYNLTFQLGFATTQICESVAVAVQTLLARELAGVSTEKTKDSKRAAIVKAKRVRHLIDGSVLVGGLVAGSLSLLTFFQRDSVLRGLTTNADIREASRIIFPAVLVTQVLKGLAYPVNGIIMGGLDWKFTMLAMWLANIVCVGMIQFWANAGVVSLGKIWWALAAFMGTQVVTGAARFQSKTGVWKILRAERGAEGTREGVSKVAASQ